MKKDLCYTLASRELDGMSFVIESHCMFPEARASWWKGSPVLLLNYELDLQPTPGLGKNWNQRAGYFLWPGSASLVLALSTPGSPSPCPCFESLSPWSQ